MNYELRHEIPPVKDYIEIRLLAGLSRKSEQAATIGLRNSLFGVVAYFEDRCIGLGRIIGDGGCFFEIVDIAVIPEHQKKGAGRKIMESLMDYLHQNAPSTAYISLIADHGTPKFYEKFGFDTAKHPEKSGMFQRVT